jgi:hypothetical protein
MKNAEVVKGLVAYAKEKADVILKKINENANMGPGSVMAIDGYVYTIAWIDADRRTTGTSICFGGCKSIADIVERAEEELQYI